MGHELANMGAIYDRATLTIVAATAWDADGGLRDIREISGPRHLAAFGDDLNKYLDPECMIWVRVELSRCQTPLLTRSRTPAPGHSKKANSPAGCSFFATKPSSGSACAPAQTKSAQIWPSRGRMEAHSPTSTSCSAASRISASPSAPCSTNTARASSLPSIREIAPVPRTFPGPLKESPTR